MRQALCLAAIALVAVLAAAAARAEGVAATVPAAISVDELAPGMRGCGLTVMKDARHGRFEVEILGVLRGAAPGRNGVIVRASGLGLEQSAIIAGMSGSPVYVDGRLVGAVIAILQGM